jgi:hypothetical protein
VLLADREVLQDQVRAPAGQAVTLAVSPAHKGMLNSHVHQGMSCHLKKIQGVQGLKGAGPPL